MPLHHNASSGGNHLTFLEGISHSLRKSPFVKGEMYYDNQSILFESGQEPLHGIFFYGEGTES